MDPQETALVHEEIYRLSRAQREAASDGDLDRVLQLLSRRGELLARVPRGEPRLRQIAELDRETERRLLHVRQQLVDELGQIQRGRVALEGYRADADGGALFLDRIC